MNKKTWGVLIVAFLALIGLSMPGYFETPQEPFYQPADEIEVLAGEVLAWTEYTEFLRDEVRELQGDMYEVNAPGRRIVRADKNYYGATFLVTAANSTDQRAGQYRASATAANVAIQAAIDAAPSQGATVQLSEGDFLLAAVIGDGGKNNIRLTGSGNSTRIKVADGLFINAIEIKGQTGWVISNLAIDGNRANQSIGNDTLSQNGVLFKTTTNSRIENTYISDTFYSNIRVVDGAVGIDIVGNTLSRTSNGDNISVRGTAGNNTSNINIVGNRASDPGYTDWGGFTIEISSYTTDVLIENNELNRGDLSNLTVHNAGASRVSIIGNLIDGADNNCIEVGPLAAEVVIANNIIVNPTEQGIRVQGPLATIIGNYIEDTTENGIVLTSTANHATVMGNVIGNTTARGIFINAADDVTVIGNVIQTPGTVGIELAAASDDIVITGNIVEGAGTWGIKVNGATSDRTIIQGNALRNNSSGAVSNAGTASIIRDNQGYITENWVTGNVTNGTLDLAVLHGLATTPTHVDLTLAGNTTNDIGTFWWDGGNTTHFVINVENDPGTAGALFNAVPVIR